jgi:hypothetical protein
MSEVFYEKNPGKWVASQEMTRVPLAADLAEATLLFPLRAASIGFGKVREGLENSFLVDQTRGLVGRGYYLASTGLIPSLGMFRNFVAKLPPFNGGHSQDRAA